MPNIMTIVPEQVGGLRKLFFRWVRREYGGVVPGVFQVLAVDLRFARHAGSLYRYFTSARRPPSVACSARCWRRSSTERSAAPPDWDSTRRRSAA